MPWLWLTIAAIIIVSSAIIAFFKLRFAKHALKDVPPDQRVEVIDAVGRAFNQWRGWR